MEAESDDVLNFKTVFDLLPDPLRKELDRHQSEALMLARRVRPFLSLYVEQMDIDIDPADEIAVAALRPALAAVAAPAAEASMTDGGGGDGVASRGGSEGTSECRSRRGRGRGKPPPQSSPLRSIARAARRILAEGTAAAATGDPSGAPAAVGQADVVAAPVPRLLRQFRVGDACLAQHRQDKWYSAVVVQVHTGAAAAVRVDYGLDSDEQAASARFEDFVSADFGGRVLNRSFHVAADRPGMPEGWQLRFTLADQLPAGWLRRLRRLKGRWDCLGPEQETWLHTSSPAVAAAEAEAAAKGRKGGPERAKRLLCAEMRRVAAEARRLAPYLFLWPGEPGYPGNASDGSGRPTATSRYFSLSVILWVGSEVVCCDLGVGRKE